MSHSDWIHVSEEPNAKALVARVAARRAWEKANPALAAEWNAALVEDHERTCAREAREARLRAWKDVGRRLKAAGVPEKPRQALAAGVLERSRPTLQAALRYLGQREKPWLMLMGATNSGKTVAGALILAEFCVGYPWLSLPSGTSTEGLLRPCVYTRAGEMNEVDLFTEWGRAWLRELRETRLLVIDDMGTETLNSEGMSRLYGVIDARYGEKRRTVLISNLKKGRRHLPTDPPAWGDRFDERFTRRIRELALEWVDGDFVQDSAPRRLEVAR